MKSKHLIVKIRGRSLVPSSLNCIGCDISVMTSDKNKWVSWDMRGEEGENCSLFSVGSSVIINHNDGQSVWPFPPSHTSPARQINADYAGRPSC